MADEKSGDVEAKPAVEAWGSGVEPDPAFEGPRYGDLSAKPEGGSLVAYGRRCVDLVYQPSASLSP
jgi:hypothetical protein